MTRRTTPRIDTVTRGGTITGDALPWDAPRDDRDRALHLVLVWSLDEPERVGESIRLASPVVVGRGEARPGDRFARAWLERVRSGRSEARAPLASRRLSRTQLEVIPDPKKRSIHLKNQGQCPLLVGSRAVTEADVRVGDVVHLKNAALFLVVERSSEPDAPRELDPNFPFGRADVDGFVGESESAWRLRDRIALAAEAARHVLVTGPSGTGKELVARAVHRRSGRPGPFVSRNASTLPDGIVDAELFGCARGYPNVGSPERTGLVAEADEGALFLDEIGELPHPVQAHLLRVLDRNGEYQRLGETKTRSSDFLALAATNRDPELLKHDLAARFPVRLETPPLDERREDVPLLARAIVLDLHTSSPKAVERFVFTDGHGAPQVRFDPRLVEELVVRDYSTHVRELERLLWSSIERSRGEWIEWHADVLNPRVMARPTPDGALGSTRLEELDEARLRAALGEANGNVTDAARQLGLKNRYVLYRLLKRFGIDADDAARTERATEPPEA